MKKTFYNKITESDNKPHAPYTPPFIYNVENGLDKALLKKADYEFIDDTKTIESDRTDILIYRAREGIYGDHRWNVPELHRPDLDRFKKSNSKHKVLIYMNLAFDDPQAYYVSFKEDVIFVDKFEDMLTHPLVNTTKENLYENYINPLVRRVGSFDVQIQRIENLRRELNCTKVIVPLMYLETFRQNGLLDTDNIVFVHNNLPIADKYIQSPIKSLNDRFFDCCITGSNYANVYPYRYAARTIVNNMNDIVIQDNTESYVVYNRKRAELIRNYEEEVRTGISKGLSDISLNQLFQRLDDEQYDGYMSMLHNSKIFVCCSSIFGYPLKKFWEGMSMGCVIVGQMPKYADKYGIKHNVHMVNSELNDLDKTIRELLRDPERMGFISNNAIELVKNSYSFSRFADNILDKII
jgi:glycosyltransferase involved in cell wall biosynthesis